jgi:CheY-like chemotaxis protein
MTSLAPFQTLRIAGKRPRPIRDARLLARAGEPTSEPSMTSVHLTRPELATTPPGKLAGQRFLVVEDEPLIAFDIAAGLEETGAEVLASTGSAREALDLIQGEVLDAALLDASLHGLPVDEIAAALTRRKVPFLFVTGYGRESLPQAFGTVAVLSKPFSLQQLIEAAARLVERRADVARLRDNQHGHRGSGTGPPS